MRNFWFFQHYKIISQKVFRYDAEILHNFSYFELSYISSSDFSPKMDGTSNLLTDYHILQFKVVLVISLFQVVPNMSQNNTQSGERTLIMIFAKNLQLSCFWDNFSPYCTEKNGQIYSSKYHKIGPSSPIRNPRKVGRVSKVLWDTVK